MPRVSPPRRKHLRRSSAGPKPSPRFGALLVGLAAAVGLTSTGCSYFFPSCQTIPGCLAGQVLCDNLTCSDLHTDPHNCGFCNNSCGPGTVCEALADGGAACGCNGQGLQQIDGRCLALQVDPLNCGAVGATCRADQACTRGTCGCPSPDYLDGGSAECPVDGGLVCANLLGDAFNCGSCGRTCDGTCVLGVCEVADAGIGDGGDAGPADGGDAGGPDGGAAGVPDGGDAGASDAGDGG